ncbi:hypothetical protein EFE22_08420 [Lactobacillus delbrueckii subsp. lactis]|nr:hypothetical protein [Lactobacillus delbrueckii subsp. lactis]
MGQSKNQCRPNPQIHTQLLHPLEHIVQTSLLCFILLARKLKPKVISKMTEVLWYLRDLHSVQKRLSLASFFLKERRAELLNLKQVVNGKFMQNVEFNSTSSA